MTYPADSIVITDWDDPKVQHAVNRAFLRMNGAWDATSEASRDRLLSFIRDEGLPDAESTYDPTGSTVPRVYIVPRGA